MGQKTPCRLNRLNIVDSQKSTAKWYADRDVYGKFLVEDIMIREYIQSSYAAAGIHKIEIDRHQSLGINIFCSKPGLLIGKKGSDIDAIKEALFKKFKVKAHVNIKEVRNPDLQAKLVSEGIAQQLERRVMYRKAMKRALQNAMRAGAVGVRIEVSGRLGGAEIARSEKYSTGRVPLHTFRADIDYHIAEALTTYGIIGVKVWIYRSDAKDKSNKNQSVKIDKKVETEK